MEASELLALRPGRVPGWKYARSVHSLGELRVLSGRLEASDPFVNLGEGLEVSIPPGTYPAFVTVADVSDEQDGSHLRESYLSLLVAEGTPARVDYLVPAGAEAPEDPESFYGIPVDAGTVGFADAEAITRCMPKGNWYEEFFDNGKDDSWFELMDSPAHYREGFANIELPAATAGENLVLCHSGWGDGFYPLLGAYDDTGDLLAVHIDLQVEEPDDQPEDDKAAPAPEAEPEGRPGFWSRLLGPKR